MASLPTFADTGPIECRASIRVRGRVQGVGFRPTVWRYAADLGLAGEVLNDGEGVLIRLCGDEDRIDALIDRLTREPPPLARIDSVMRSDFTGDVTGGFRIVETEGGGAHTQVAPDAVLCAACAEETLAPGTRRHLYPFTNCTHCGPRLSIIEAIPYDRASTTMRGFALCRQCRAEYGDPADRRFHAEPIACPACGPRATLVRLADGEHVETGDPVAAASDLLADGAIVAIKGLGGYQLVCDAMNADAVARLRAGKRRDGKPFALMARDVDVICRFAHLDAVEEAALTGASTPIVLLRTGGEPLPEAIAPGLDTLGFMLPTTPLHLLLLEGWDRPLVMTSGNVSGEPQITDDAEARARLAGIAGHALVHDRPIANRVDDSVVRVMAGEPRLLRRARGYAPAPIPLPPGFEDAPDILAMGGELKATFALVKDGAAILSQHIGDLEQLPAWEDYERNLALYERLFDHCPMARAIDMHPEYLSSKAAREEENNDGLPLIEVQHHHAHIAACLAENGRALDAPPVLGIALDGLGWGADGTLWGGELLRADYLGFERLAFLKPVAMPGGAQAAREPWRNLHAQLRAVGLDTAALCPDLRDMPLATLGAMLAKGLNSPLASSTGRLFDAVAAALGLCARRQSHEGEAAARLEALANSAGGEVEGYAFGIGAAFGVPTIDPAPLWPALFDDLAAGVPRATIAAQFHTGFADAIIGTVRRIRKSTSFDTVALSGGCFHNRLLFERVSGLLECEGFAVLSHRMVPAGDGGLALGQAAVATARLLKENPRSCA